MFQYLTVFDSISWEQMICCTAYILHVLDCILLMYSCTGVTRQMQMKYSEHCRLGSGDEITLSFSLSLPLSGGLYFWNQPISFTPDWKYTEDLQEISCLLCYYYTVANNNMVFGESSRIPFCLHYSCKLIGEFSADVMYLRLNEHKHISGQYYNN